MKNIRKALIIALTLCALTALLTVSAWADGTVSPNPATVNAGSSVNVTAAPSYDPYPADVNYVSYLWSTDSSNISLANETSQTATVYGASAGEAVVKCVITYTAKADPTLQASENAFVTVNVLSAPLTVSISGNENVEVNTTAQYTLNASGNVSFVNWQVVNMTGQANIDPSTGVLTAVKPGTVEVRVSGSDDVGRPVSASKTVNITYTPPMPSIQIASIYIDNPGKVFSGSAVQLKAVVNGNYSTDVSWSIIDGAELASINPNTGVLTVNSASYGRRVTVKAESIYNSLKYDTKGIDIIAPYVEISSSNGTTLSAGQTTQLTAINYPLGSQSGWAWSFTDSSFENYAELTWDGSNKCTLKIKNAGVSVIVRATDSNNVSATITINTSSAHSGTKTLSISSNQYYPTVGQTIEVRAQFSNTYDSDNTVTHWVYDKNILDMTYNDAVSAKFKAVRNGSTKITAYARKDNEMYGVESNSIDITVSGSVLNHQITYGNYSTFDGTNPLYFITNDYITNFKGVTVDGYVLTNGNQYYSTSSSDGHILVAMNPAYLKMLSSSSYHTIQIYSTVNGPATGYFRNYGVSQTIYGVRTGDDNNIALWVTLCTLGFAGAAAIIIMKRREIFGK